MPPYLGSDPSVLLGSPASSTEARPPLTLDAFWRLRGELDNLCVEILNSKGVDIARHKELGDRLGNFRRIALLLGVEPREVWVTYFLKHVDVLIRWATTGGVESEPLEGRFADARNYIDLGYAIWKHLG
jgi:hypothetical protein